MNVVVGTLVFFDEATALRGAAKIQKTLPREDVYVGFKYDKNQREYRVTVESSSEEMQAHCSAWLRELAPVNFPGLTHVELPVVEPKRPPAACV